MAKKPELPKLFWLTYRHSDDRAAGLVAIESLSVRVSGLRRRSGRPRYQHDSCGRVTCHDLVSRAVYPMAGDLGIARFRNLRICEPPPRAPSCREETKTTAIEFLTDLLKREGPLKAVRVSSPTARGADKAFSYWGIAHYEIKLSRRGMPTNLAIDRANSGRHSCALTLTDAQNLAKRQKWIVLQQIGMLTEADAREVLHQWSRLFPNGSAFEAARTLRAIRNWTLRCLDKSGLKITYMIALGALTQAEIKAVEDNELRLIALSQQRAARKAPPLRRLHQPREVRLWKHGIELVASISNRARGRPLVVYRVADFNAASVHTRWREAIRYWISCQPKRIGDYFVFRNRLTNPSRRPAGPTWVLRRAYTPQNIWEGRRNRDALAAAIRTDLRAARVVRAALPDLDASDTLGWRCWIWDEIHQRLCSPHQGAVWWTPELRVDSWSTKDAVRGHAGAVAA
jgi:hypothetical protein